MVSAGVKLALHPHPLSGQKECASHWKERGCGGPSGKTVRKLMISQGLVMQWVQAIEKERAEEGWDMM